MTRANEIHMIYRIAPCHEGIRKKFLTVRTEPHTELSQRDITTLLTGAERVQLLDGTWYSKGDSSATAQNFDYCETYTPSTR